MMRDERETRWMQKKGNQGQREISTKRAERKSSKRREIKGRDRVQKEGKSRAEIEFKKKGNQGQEGWSIIKGREKNKLYCNV
jgi:hypothetical protein